MLSAVSTLFSGFVPTSFLIPGKVTEVVEDFIDERFEELRSLLEPFKLFPRLINMKSKMCFMSLFCEKTSPLS